MVVRWWPHTDDPRVASYRLRCLQIVAALQSAHIDADLYDPARDRAPTVLVLSKRYDAASLAQAKALQQRAGTRLLLDLCDNHFHVQGQDTRLLQRAEALRDAVRSVDRIVTASQALADIVQVECPPARVTVIPDAIEAPFEPTRIGRLRDPRGELQLARLAAALRRSGVTVARRLLWFGNHGSAGAEGGMSDLLRIADAVTLAHRTQPISLTVISNNADRFASLSTGWEYPTFYLPWRAGTFSRAVRLHGAAVIPIGLNPFTRCKTNNRVATAFLHGLNVIADGIPSYQEFGDCAVLDDWPRGLGVYLADPQQRATDVLTGQRRVRQRYSLDAVTALWRNVIAQAASPGERE